MTAVRTATVWLWRDRWNRPQAHCDCGWKGQPRWLRPTASSDALTHTVRSGHWPADPIDRWPDRISLFADLHAAFWLICFIAIMAYALAGSVVLP